MKDNDVHQKLDYLVSTVGEIKTCLQGFSKNGNDGLIKRVETLEGKGKSKFKRYVAIIALVIGSPAFVLGLIEIFKTVKI